MHQEHHARTQPDPRRWITLTVLLATVVLVSIDTSVLNVAVPTMLVDLRTTVPSLEWVIAGYSLTIASLLIVGGRLGDIFGHRRLFAIGVSLFGLGSLVASVSPNVGTLILGEAVIEGVGAALMIPSTLAILSTTFHGRERATAFAAWGAAAGAAVAFGPVLGGYLTTNYSWRWSFRINVIVAPVAAVAALLFMARDDGVRRRTPIDVLGAALITSGMFLVVFALSQGPTYGWLRPEEAFSVAGRDLWPTSMPVSIITAAFVVGLLLLAAFVAVEWRKQQQGRHPLFDLSQFRFRTFRYGVITALILSMGQLGVLFAIPLFLQGAAGLSAEENGLWMLPLGLAVIVGAQLGGRLNSRLGTTNLVRIGLFVEAFGIVVLTASVHQGVTFWQVLPGMVPFGIGLGFAVSQLTSVVLWEVPAESSGVASGANSTARQLGAALGATVIGTLVTVVTTGHAVDAIRGAGLDPTTSNAAIGGIEQLGASWRVPPGTAPEAAATLHDLFSQSLASGVRWALVFAASVVFAGAVLSLLIPHVGRAEATVPEAEPRPADALAGTGTVEALAVEAR